MVTMAISPRWRQGIATALPDVRWMNDNEFILSI
jgi:hypothetical protein